MLKKFYQLQTVYGNCCYRIHCDETGKTRALSSARRLLLKTIVFDVMHSRYVVMSPPKKRCLRKEATLRSKAVQASKAISATK